MSSIAINLSMNRYCNFSSLWFNIYELNYYRFTQFVSFFTALYHCDFRITDPLSLEQELPVSPGFSIDTTWGGVVSGLEAFCNPPRPSHHTLIWKIKLQYWLLIIRYQDGPLHVNTGNYRGKQIRKVKSPKGGENSKADNVIIWGSTYNCRLQYQV